jgi:hypothetical protein
MEPQILIDGQGTVRRWLESPRTSAARCASVLERLNKLGLAPHSESRLARYARQLDSIAGNRVYDPRKENSAVAHRALVELLQLELALDHLGRAPEVPAWREMMQRALDGRDLPHDDKPEVFARSIQFELFFAAVLRASGFDVSFREPDILLRDGDVERVIAAKRLRSTTNVRQNIRKAEKQIDRSGCQGAIALDLAFPAVVHRQDLPDADAVTTAAQVLVRSFVRDHLSLFPRWCRSPRTELIIVHASIPCVVGLDRGVQHWVSTWWSFLMLPQISLTSRGVYRKMESRILELRVAGSP